MLLEFSDSLQTEILSTETSDFLKQIIFLNSFESVFKAGPKVVWRPKNLNVHHHGTSHIIFGLFGYEIVHLESLINRFLSKPVHESVLNIHYWL